MLPLPDPSPIAETGAQTPLEEIFASPQPQVIRGLVAHWPLVAAAASDHEAVAYLKRFANDALPAIATVAPPEAGGRIFYDDAFGGFNFRREQVPLTTALNTLLKYRGQPDAPTIYLGATTCDTWLPGLRAANPIDLGARDALASIWIGNRSRVPAHQDLPDNLACVAAGHRRFTLFPPHQLPNLYVGPLDFTPAGQPVSLVDMTAPDLERFPRFAEAWRHAQVAELGPGDALFIPSMWWHHIQALDDFNVLLNYWWRTTPDYMDTPVNALMLAILCLRDLPAEQRASWQEVFRHYVFEFDAEQVTGHIPEHARHVLGELDSDKAAHLRAHLLQRLDR
ncbi:Pass1-related protein [uncultured Stenotrophomonas sp.]|uniref:Pass1-related protein n=1 Tax=uncultured Stenotrophomonas sp. TaxID=165438 RepID=A0A1Y5QAG3_9GAMM|nr:Pass1-related protein [uncultured Stenotrophomonas sp.]